jgi:hypothetical protein
MNRSSLSETVFSQYDVTDTSEAKVLKVVQKLNESSLAEAIIDIGVKSYIYPEGNLR